MTTIQYSRPKNTYFYVLSDGKFHTEAKEGDEGAVKREYETSDGKKGVKIEKTAEKISGKITNISVYEGDYGKLLQLTFGDNELITSFNTNSAFGEDIMKKLPNINFDEDVTLAPYAFEDDNGKSKKGVTIYQKGTKIQDYYHKKDGDKYVSINGYPEPKDIQDKESWKIYFLQARKFLVGEVMKHKMYNAKPGDTDTTFDGYPVDDTVKPDSIPF